jgi:hypothetical protein
MTLGPSIAYQHTADKDIALPVDSFSTFAKKFGEIFKARIKDCPIITLDASNLETLYAMEQVGFESAACSDLINQINAFGTIRIILSYDS